MINLLKISSNKVISVKALNRSCLKYLSPFRSFCELKNEKAESNHKTQQTSPHFDNNNSCLILKEMNNKYALSISQMVLLSLSSFSLYHLINSVMIAKVFPILGWGFLSFFTLQLNANLIKNQRQVIREIRINRKPAANYELQIKVMGSFKILLYDLNNLSIKESIDKNTKWPKELFTRLLINNHEYVIPVKTVVIFNEKLFSKILNGRISDYFV